MRLITLLAAIPAIATLCVAPASAKDLRDFVPPDAPNCAVTAPPAEAGFAMGPGGNAFLVHPRNAGIAAGYTGCKLLWAVQGETKAVRFVSLYFKQGKLAVAVAHDGRSPDGAVVGVCTFPGGKSLLPTGAAADRACAGVPKEYYTMLRTPTLPRECLTNPRAKVCSARPA